MKKELWSRKPHDDCHPTIQALLVFLQRHAAYASLCQTLRVLARLADSCEKSDPCTWCLGQQQHTACVHVTTTGQSYTGHSMQVSPVMQRQLPRNCQHTPVCNRYLHLESMPACVGEVCQPALTYSCDVDALVRAVECAKNTDEALGSCCSSNALVCWTPPS